jgi:hypothetical protein
MVEGVVSATEAYQEFEKRNNRFVNMLTDNVTFYTCFIHPDRTETSADKVLRG